MTRMKFARLSTRAEKANRGRTELQQTPISVRTSIALNERFQDRIPRQLARRVGHVAELIERGTVRFEDLNGPRGGIDTVCRIKLVISGRPSIIVTKEADSPERAFASANKAIGTAIETQFGKHRLRAGRAVRPQPSEAPMTVFVDTGEIIGRRTGHGPEALERALERPEKANRAAYIDTALPGVNSSDRRAGGPMTARRNSHARTTRDGSMLEDSRTRPSRKSTRRSANRSKASSGIERAFASRIQKPSSRHARRG